MRARTATWVACALLAAALPVSWFAGRGHDVSASLSLARPLGDAVPLTHAGWTGVDEPLTEAEQQVVGADDAIKRGYTHEDGSVVSLFTTFYGNKQRGIDAIYHNASVCYPAQGFTQIDTDFDEIVLKDLAKQVPVCRYVFERRGTRLNVLTFCKVNDELIDQSPRNKPFWLLGDKLLSRFDDAPGTFAQVQVVAVIRDGDEFAARRAQTRFLEDFGRVLFAAIEPVGASH
jgi:EpsI family protein